MISRSDRQYLRIRLASPEQIRSWANRTLPNGETVGRVTRHNTIHYKTHKPERDGLFCERIFGPVKSGTCACGKYFNPEKQKDAPKMCELCGIEYISARARRHRMGYVQLACPVTHIWYFKRRPSFIASLLQRSLKHLASLVYCDV